MTTSPSICVSRLLLASYAALLGVGGVGLWVSVNNFWEEELLPPTLPPSLENSTSGTMTATTASSHHGYNHNSRNEEKVPEAYKDYVHASVYFASSSMIDARVYVAVPCAVCVAMAALVLVAGLWSRQFFSSTFSLYGSLGMSGLTLIVAIIYYFGVDKVCHVNLVIEQQNLVGWDPHTYMDFICWVVAFHVVLMLLLSAQILLSMLELRRQQAGWPTINFRNVFTVEALLVTARMTLTVFIFMMLDIEQMFKGYEKDRRYEGLWGTPRHKFPIVFLLVCSIAACFNAVATVETMMSMLFGKLHKNMTTVTSLLSALCCVTVAVLNSPGVLKVITNSNRLYPEGMHFASGLSVVLFLHVMISLVFPISSRSPVIINKISDFLVLILSSHRGATLSEKLFSLPLLQRKGKNFMIFNLISAIFTTLSIIISAAVWDSPMYYPWGSVMVMCVNSATLVRTLPAFMTVFVLKEAENTTVNQRLMAMSLECFGLLVGASAMCAESWGTGGIFVGSMNLLFLVFQIFIIAPLLREQIGPKTLSNETESNVKTEVPKEGKDDEQNPVATLP